MLESAEEILTQLGNRSIFLTGFMGTGKTTIGYNTADWLGIPFYDIDHLIERTRGVALHEIFQLDGESIFRKIESAILREIIKNEKPNLVSLGGGTLVEEVNRTLVRNNGILIALKADPAYILPRLNESQIASLLMITNRPISDSLFTNRIHAAIEELIKLREPVYDDVDFWVDSGGKDIEEISEEILSLLGDFLSNDQVP